MVTRRSSVPVGSRVSWLQKLWTRSLHRKQQHEYSWLTVDIMNTQSAPQTPAWIFMTDCWHYEHAPPPGMPWIFVTICYNCNYQAAASQARRLLKSIVFVCQSVGMRTWQSQWRDTVMLDMATSLLDIQLVRVDIQQGRIQKYGLGGREGVKSHPLPSTLVPPLPSP